MFKKLFIYIGLLLFLPGVVMPAKAEDAPMSKPNAYSYEFLSIDGEPVRLSDYKGKVILVVNTASNCGFTPQYKGLQILHQTYKERGLVVLGVPSADFGGQEFPDAAQVKNFTHEKFSITFPLTEISKVRGEDAHPFYKWAAQQVGPESTPQWNFHKYLIDKQGNLVAGYRSMVSPLAPSITRRVEEELGKE